LLHLKYPTLRHGVEFDKRTKVLVEKWKKKMKEKDFNEMITEILDIYRNFRIDNVYIDNSVPEIIRPIKQALNELNNLDYNEEIRSLKSRHRNPTHYMRVIPVSFREEHKELLTHAKRLLDAEVLACSSPTFDKVVTAMRTAYGVESNLMKKVGSHADILDALMLSLKHFVLPPIPIIRGSVINN
jgi:hypothetical protein